MAIMWLCGHLWPHLQGSIVNFLVQWHSNFEWLLNKQSLTEDWYKWVKSITPPPPTKAILWYELELCAKEKPPFPISKPWRVKTIFKVMNLFTTNVIPCLSEYKINFSCNIAQNTSYKNLMECLGIKMQDEFGMFFFIYILLKLLNLAYVLIQLARATVRDPKTGVLTVANYRVSKR